MYDIQKKQYIVKLSSGRILNYFTDDRLGLMYSVLSKRNVWSDPVPAIKDCTGRIALEVGGEDQIHVLYQTRQGNIFYAVNTNNNWINHPVLNSKNPGVYDKHLQLRLIGQDTHFFYTLRHKDNTILAHQSIIKKSHLSSPEVIDYVTSCDVPYTVSFDQQSNIYAYYSSSDGKYKQIGCRIFSMNSSKWSEFKPITTFKGDHENPKAIMDHSDNVHLIYTRRAGSGYDLIYRSRSGSQNLWSTEKSVTSSLEPITTASLICVNEEVILFWVRESGISYSILPANTLPSVIKVEKYSFADLRQVSCIGYKTNLMGELARFRVNEVPGIFINGFRLAFINDHLTQDFNSFTPEELRGMIVDGLKMLTSQVNYLRENQQKLESNYYGISSNVQSMQRDITKSILKIDMLDKEIRNLKYSLQSYSQRTDSEFKTPEEFKSPADSKVQKAEPVEDFLPQDTTLPDEDAPLSEKDAAFVSEDVPFSEDTNLPAEPAFEMLNKAPQAKELHSVKDSLLEEEPLSIKEIHLSDEPAMKKVSFGDDNPSMECKKPSTAEEPFNDKFSITDKTLGL